jgi:tripartite-type tricarboxylate transporter receptor subunit TctC
MKNIIHCIQKCFSVEVPLEREVEQCLFYRVNLSEETYDEWKCSMQKMLFSEEVIDRATVIMREKKKC